MDIIESGRIPCLGTEIAYRRRRGDGRSLVLVHGISDDGNAWMPLLPLLSPDWDIVMVDLRGHGRSADPENGWTIRTMADEIACLIATLSLKKPRIAGHSLGAAVTLALASYCPDVPKAIFLEDPIPIWNATPETMAATGTGLAGWLSSVKRKTRADLEAEVQGNVGWDEAEFDAWIDSKLLMSPRVIAMVTSVDFSPRDFNRAVTAVKCPAFLLTSDVKRGALVRDEDLRAFESLVPDAKTKRLVDVGHCIRRESPVEYLTSFRAFFA
jgi:pimeloyl-ACP methyl ester carboxylesterase